MTKDTDFLTGLDVTDLTSRFRRQQEEAHTGHAALDYSGIFKMAVERTFQYVDREISSVLSQDAFREYYRGLRAMGVRPNMVLAWTTSAGYGFGSTIYQLAENDSNDGNTAARHEIALGIGFAMYFSGLYDQLIDEHPASFRYLSEKYAPNLARTWALDGTFDSMPGQDEPAVVATTFALYRLYFQRCRALWKSGVRDDEMLQRWADLIHDVHASQVDSLERTMRGDPAEAIERAFWPSKAGYLALGASCCLSQPLEIYQALEPFIERHARWTWIVDDVMDIKDDVGREIWSGVTARIASRGMTMDEAYAVIDELAVECNGYLDELYERCGTIKLYPDDEFSSADFLWGIMWGWLGGQIDFF